MKTKHHNISIDERLETVRLGTEHFAEALAELYDADLDGDSLLPGWTRRHVVAHVGYNALAIARLVEWANTGIETPMYESPEARDNEIAHGAALSARELRRLFEHSAAELERAWRGLPEKNWTKQVKTSKGLLVPASETVWMRTREVWIHAVDLDDGASFDDIPDDVLAHILTDITSTWKDRGDGAGLRLAATDGSQQVFGDQSADAEVVSGSLADLAAWATGRSTDGVSSSTEGLPVAPVWI